MGQGPKGAQHTPTYLIFGAQKPSFTPFYSRPKRGLKRGREKEEERRKRGKKRRESEPSLAFVGPRTIFTPF